ncbi:hypothetical protein BGL52_01300 [Lacticaseibacillus casei]|uniref:Uncharacterized protein n=1 Tax=Lacticaseibacillus casei TaxID=1582 RepID=A0AAN1EXU3_LACCA|nr:hypothetical protein BGL52_01300 [Lacticaseibacillus casei]
MAAFFSFHAVLAVFTLFFKNQKEFRNHSLINKIMRMMSLILVTFHIKTASGKRSDRDTSAALVKTRKKLKI